MHPKALYYGRWSDCMHESISEGAIKGGRSLDNGNIWSNYKKINSCWTHRCRTNLVCWMMQLQLESMTLLQWWKLMITIWSYFGCYTNASKIHLVVKPELFSELEHQWYLRTQKCSWSYVPWFWPEASLCYYRLARVCWGLCYSQGREIGK